MRNDSPPPLDGIRVVEWCSGLAGAFAARLLADAGAEVVKVEPPGGDRNRHAGSTVSPGADHGSLFWYCNAGKKSVVLDSDVPDDVDALHSLAAGADIVISDAPARLAAAAGMTTAETLRRNPDLVHVVVRPYATSAVDDREGFDLDVFMSAGEGIQLPGGLSYEQFPERQPLLAGRHMVSYDAGIAVATAACAALLNRLRGRGGSAIELSQQDVQISLNRVTLDLQLNQGHDVDRAHRGYDFGGIFPCADGYVTVRPNEDRHWSAMAAAMGLPELADDERFRTRAARETNAAQLNQIVRDYTRTRSRDEIYRAIAGAGAPVGSFDEPERIRASDQFAARGWFRPGTLRGSEAALPGLPFLLTTTPGPPFAAAPALGEHTDEVLLAGHGVKT
jgi:crotonobetainyl-CoA:carnitine CoA-transferase CaiB-like acyl-CoA transferase